MPCVYTVISLIALLHDERKYKHFLHLGNLFRASSLIEIQTYSAQTLQLYNLMWGILM